MIDLETMIARIRPMDYNGNGVGLHPLFCVKCNSCFLGCWSDRYIVRECNKCLQVGARPIIGEGILQDVENN